MYGFSTLLALGVLIALQYRYAFLLLVGLIPPGRSRPPGGQGS
jgi:hypothetical protein